MKKRFLIFSFMLLAVFACSDDDNKGGTSGNSVSFAVPSVNLTEDVTPVVIKFASPTSSAGTISLAVVETEAEYGVDYSTNPASSNGLEVEFESGATEVSFDFNKLLSAIEGQVKNVEYTITDVSANYQITGIATTVLNFNETALTGNHISPEVGGPTQPNQVYVDLSSGGTTTVPRISWDLGFYGGDDFRVILNNSVKMSAKSLDNIDLTAVVSEDSSMLVGLGAGSVNQVDDATGAITGTAIAEIAANDDDNFVYLVNLGNEPSPNNPALGSVGSDGGPHRGWKKVRILRDGQGYKFQYADLDATTFNEVTIDKNSAYNFTFFSFTSDSTVNVEPEKDKWDLNFTTFTNVVNFGQLTPYFYSDFVVNNSRGGALVYRVSTDDFTYNNFSLGDVVHSNFTEDQRGIGDSWRATSVTGDDGIPVSQFVVKDNVFYVLKDPSGNLYKLRMTGGVLENGERGHPSFQYELL